MTEEEIIQRNLRRKNTRSKSSSYIIKENPKYYNYQEKVPF